MSSFNKTVQPYLSVLDNKYVSACLTIILIVYASLAAPKLPENVARLFDNSVFKLVLFFLIVYLAKHDATLAIIAAVAVLVSLMTLNKWDVSQEMMANISKNELAENLEKCNNWDCSPQNDPVVPQVLTPWTDQYQPDPNEHAESDIGNANPYFENNPVQSLYRFKDLPEEDQIQEIINEKNRVEMQLQRKLTPNELKNMCTRMSGASVNHQDIGKYATLLLNNDVDKVPKSSQIEGYENNESSSYAMAM